MKDHKGDIRGFSHLSEAWYGPANFKWNSDHMVDEVTFGYFSPEGGTSGWMSVRWYELGGKVHPKLECFDDAWHALSTFPELIAAMGDLDDTDPTPKQFCALLQNFGFTDLTARRNPYGTESRPASRETMLENALGAIVDAVVDNDTPHDINVHVQNAKKLLGRK